MLELFVLSMTLVIAVLIIGLIAMFIVERVEDYKEKKEGK